MLAEDCPFCHIHQGRGPAERVDEDQYTLAFLDKHPINPGHLLVIPKQHVPDFFALEEPHFGALMRSVKHLAAVLAVVTQPKKVGVVIAGYAYSGRGSSRRASLRGRSAGSLLLAPAVALLARRGGGRDAALALALICRELLPCARGGVTVSRADLWLRPP